MSDVNTRMRRLPAVTALLEDDGAAALLAGRAHDHVVTVMRHVLDAARQDVLAGADAPDADTVLAAVAHELERRDRPGLRRVINATGIVLHTGIGRAVLPQAAIDALVSEASGYCMLAVDPETGERGRRERFCEDILKEITGCESATVVNNNAAGTMLALNTLAEGKEVVVSRGQLVEIGGSYRMPDVMDRSGCKMVEVGCTNRTHLRDYREAITENTGALVRVHTSNYRIEGFTSEVSLEDMVALGNEHGIPVIDDLGSGALHEVIPGFGEPLVRRSLEAGAALVTCSADKLIGGPQGGILLGPWKYVRAAEKNQLSRTLRIGKLDLIALEATLRLFRDRATLLREHPTSRMLAETQADLEPRARVLAEELTGAASWTNPTVEDGESFAGSGTLPAQPIPSRVVAIDPPPGMSAAEFTRALRVGTPSVFTRVRFERITLDPRTIQPGENADLVDAIATLGSAQHG